MTFACLADLHGVWLPPVPVEAEAVLLAGDLCPDHGALGWLRGDFADWARDLKRPVVATWGNHDWIGVNAPADTFSFLPPWVRLVQDDVVTVGDTRIWCTPWSPWFGRWAFMDDELGLATRYTRIPESTQVIVSHGPPHGAGDRARHWSGTKERHAGSTALRDRFLALPNARTLVCGHIHEAAGLHSLGGKLVVNASQVDRHYHPLPDAVPVITVTNKFSYKAVTETT